MNCPHCHKPMTDMLDDILDGLVDRGIAIKPSQARQIRHDVLASGIAPTVAAS